MKPQERFQDEFPINIDGIEPNGDSALDRLLRSPLVSIRSFDNKC
ncbi:hypothetical protein ABGB12_21860 [Actinocorallia sp. B10E7]